MANVTQWFTLDTTLIRPLNKGQGHSFWYQSISHIRLSMLWICSRTHRLATIYNVTDDDDDRQTHKRDRPFVMSAKNWNRLRYMDYGTSLRRGLLCSIAVFWIEFRLLFTGIYCFFNT